MENGAMTSVISKLADIDPVFREVMENLYPEVDPREMWDLSKSMPDQTVVHVSGAKKDRRKKVALASGLLAGSAIEAVAAKDTIKPLVADIREAKGKGKGIKGTLRAYKNLHPGMKPPRIGTGGKAALMVGNFGVGLGAAKVLMTPEKKKRQLSKADFEPILKARREGVITTEKALELIDIIDKAAKAPPLGRAAQYVNGRRPQEPRLIFHPVKRGKNALHSVRSIDDTLSMAGFVSENAAAKTQRELVNTQDAVNRGRKSLGAVVVGGAGGYGYHRGKKKESKKLQTPGYVPQSSVKKSDEVDYGFEGEISKVDVDKRQVFGWCSLSTVNGEPVVDLQNDYISIEEIEKSAYDYVKKSRKGGDMHARLGDEPMHTSDMIESVIITPEKLQKMGIPDEAISKVNTGWWVGYQVNDDHQWELVKKGERTGFSIHGKGARVEKVL